MWAWWSQSFCNCCLIPSYSSFSFPFFHFVPSLSPYLSSAVPWAATRRELLQWSTKSSLFLPFLLLSLALMHTSSIYRMQCHSRNSQIAPCSLNMAHTTLTLSSSTPWSICSVVSLYLMLISVSSALWDTNAIIWFYYYIHDSLLFRDLLDHLLYMLLDLLYHQREDENKLYPLW